MSEPLAIGVRTAFTLREVLSQTDEIKFHLAQLSDDACRRAGIDSALEIRLRKMIDRAEILANASWLEDSPELNDLVGSIVGAIQLSFVQSGSSAVAVTPGVASNLHSRWKAARAAKTQTLVDEETGYFFRSRMPEIELLSDVAAEGILDWTLRTPEDRKLRTCVVCGRWFNPQRRSGRFCSPKHRKTFSNVKASPRETVRAFTCATCDTVRMADDFSGLVLAEPDWPLPTKLRMGSYMGTYGAAYDPASPFAFGDFYAGLVLKHMKLCCKNCVNTKHPEWRAYIGIER